MDKLRFPEGHPFWNIIRLIVIFVGVTVLLYLNADKFDDGELRTILELVVLVAGFEVAKRSLLKKGPDNS